MDTSAAKTLELFKVDPALMNPEREMEEMFGHCISQGEVKSNKPHNSGSLLRTKGKHVYKRLIIQPRGYWPASKIGLSMEHVLTDANGINHFTFVASAKYKASLICNSVFLIYVGSSRRLY